MAKALGHPVRIRIVRLLLDRDTCVCGEIVDRIPLAQSTVSQHLKILKDAGLIRGTIEGPRTCYCINHQALDRFKSLVVGL
jgi:ArsR family transcriptional regulator, arsenate/arsenite/antimonite-responsive transcriptional repressor